MASAHEITHHIRETAPEAYEALVQFMIRKYAEAGKSVSDMVDAQLAKAKRSENDRMTREEALEEFVADSMETMFTDSNAVQRFVELREENKSLFDRIVEALYELSQKIHRFYAAIQGGPETAEGQFVAEMKEGMDELEELFAQAMAEAAGSGRVKESGNQKRYKLREYSWHQKNNWANSKRIVLYENDDQYRDFIDGALSSTGGSGRKIYFGQIPADLATAIKNNTGIDVEGYNLSISEYEIRKISKSHGSDTGETLRGQKQFTKEDYVNIPKVVQQPDSITRSKEDYQGKPAIEFKQVNGNETTTVVAVVSNKHLDLFVQTSYINKKTGSIATPKSVRADLFTSETPGGTAPNVSVPWEAADVKQNFSLRDSDDSELSEGQREPDIRYSIREWMTEQERFEELKDRKLTVFSDNRTSAYQEELDSLEALNAKAKGDAERVIKPLARKLGIINTPLSTTEVDIEFLFTASGGLAESTHKQLRYGGSYADFAKALINFESVLKSAVLIEVHGDKYKGTVRENKNLEAVYVLFSAFRDGTTIIPVQLEMKKSSDVGGRLYLTVALTKIEADVTGSALSKTRTPSLISASEYSLADIFGKINPVDKHFLKYVPDDFLSDEQLQAKQDALGEDERRISGYARKNSLRDPLQTEVSRTLQRENEKLKEDLTYFRQLLRLQGKVTNGTKFRRSSVQAMAKNLMKSFGARGDSLELTKLLEPLYEFMAQDPELTVEELSRQARPAVDWLHSHVRGKTETDEYSREVLDAIRSARITLSDQQKGEAASRSGKETPACPKETDGRPSWWWESNPQPFHYE